MSGVVGEAIRRADMDPPALFADAHPCFIRVGSPSSAPTRFEAPFHLGQLLMTGFDKGGDASCRELDSQQLLQ
jgi:hypothetical protein